MYFTPSASLVGVGFAPADALSYVILGFKENAIAFALAATVGEPPVMFVTAVVSAALVLSPLLVNTRFNVLASVP